jgi:hypothetical protein
VGRARERVKSSEVRQGVCAGHWRGSKKGSWARGRASWPRNPMTCASAHSPIHGESREGGTNKAGPRRREREKGKRGGNGSTPANRAHETEREREGGHAQGRTAADRRGPHVRRRGRAAWLGLMGRLGCFLLFFFSGFSNSFSISFSIGFSNPNSN